MTKEEPAYRYTDSGIDVELAATPLVAIDLDRATDSIKAGRLQQLKDQAEPVRHSIVITMQSGLDSAELDRLDEAGAAFPVLASEDGTLLVVMPEVRVESVGPDDPDARDTTTRQLHEMIDGLEANVVKETSRTLVVEPASGRGEDALDIASQLAKVPGVVSQPRFLRIVARPDQSKAPKRRHLG